MTKHPQKNPIERHMEQLVYAHSGALDACLRESDQDMGRMVAYLQQRMELEEGYQISLDRINQSFRGDRHPGKPLTSLSKAFQSYVDLGDSLRPFRAQYIQTLKTQLQTLRKLQEQHEGSTQKQKKIMRILTAQYLNARLRELPEVREAYIQRCEELERMPASAIGSPTVAMPLSPASLMPRTSTSSTTSSFSLSSIASARRPSGSGMALDEPSTPLSPAVSISSSDYNLTPTSTSSHRRFDRFKKQLSNLGNAHGDTMRQNTKAVKAKMDIGEADTKYRNVVRKIDSLSMRQASANETALKTLQTQLSENSQAIRSFLEVSIDAEIKKLQALQEVMRNTKDTVHSINPEWDSNVYNGLLDKSQFPSPEPVRYVNYYIGECRDLLFGISLSEYAQKKQRSPPLIVSKCIEAIEARDGLLKEGIYRISGKQSKIDKLKQEFERDEEALTFGENDIPDDVFTIASVLKIFLRELATPLFPFKLDERITFAQIPDKELRLLNLLTRLLKLPPANYDTLKLLIGHLAKLVSFVDKNKMTIDNLTLIFTPAIFQDHNRAQRSPGDWKADCVLQDLIENYETMFANKDLRNASSITGVIDYGFEQHNDDELYHEEGIYDLELSPSSLEFDGSPTESNTSQDEPTSNVSQPSKFRAVSQDKGLKVNTSKPNIASTQAPMDAKTSPIIFDTPTVQSAKIPNPTYDWMSKDPHQHDHSAARPLQRSATVGAKTTAPKSNYP